MSKELIIIGGGLAGSEAAWQAANKNIKVTLYELRHKDQKTEAHQTDGLAELVCSNSFRSDDMYNSAIGLLHQEMRLLNSLVLACADNNKLPAGGALAVDRERFSAEITDKITNHPNIKIIREGITDLAQFKDKNVIIATGPLTSNALALEIQKLTGEEYLAFFDAIAPIVYKDSIDFNIAWYQSRYDKITPGTEGENEGKDYINCPLTREQYYNFVEKLIASDVTDFKEWEKNTPYFEGCLPIEVMASRGIETLRFGPMKPVGLTNPNSTEKPYAVVQLRQDNALGSLYNIVGFQTKIKYGNQTELFKMIPGLQNAEFARLGGLHRNTFIKSPILLDQTLRLKSSPNIRFAGQITGVEGYVESAACGLLAGLFAAAELNDTHLPNLPAETALGSLLNHITGNANIETFQPMNINFGLFPEITRKVKKTERKKEYCTRALKAISELVG